MVRRMICLAAAGAAALLVILLILTYTHTGHAQAAGALPSGADLAQGASPFKYNYLPMMMKGVTAAHEVYAVSNSLQPVTITALGGSLVINIPAQSVPLSKCKLYVDQADPTAVLMSVNLSLICELNPGQFYSYDLYHEATIRLSYAHFSTAYLDEARMQMVGAASSSVDTANKMVLGQSKTMGSFAVAVGYSITDLAPAPSGTVFAAASPLIYRISPGSTSLQRAYDLTSALASLNPTASFSRFAVNPATGTVYIPLKLAGGVEKVYAFSSGSPVALFTAPSPAKIYGVTYDAVNSLLYVSYAKVTGQSGGCVTLDATLVAVNPANGAVLSTAARGYNALVGMTVNSQGRLLGTYYEEINCWFGVNRDNYTLDTYASTGLPIGSPSHYLGFKGAAYLTSDAQGNSYLANQVGNAISIVSGPASTLTGVIHLPSPGPIAIAGSNLVVVSNGQLQVVSTGARDTTARRVFYSPSASIAGNNGAITVYSETFDPVPAHNFLMYNGQPSTTWSPQPDDFGMGVTQAAFTYAPLPPDGLLYHPWTQNQATLNFQIDGNLVNAVQITAPEMPVEALTLSTSSLSGSLGRGQWAALTFGCCKISSQEGLFPQAAGGMVYYQFTSVGVFHFHVTGNTSYPTFDYTLTVTPFGSPHSQNKTLLGAQGGVLWAGNAALEIPPGALPTVAGGYQVTFSSETNTLPVKDAISDASLVYKFSFTPEVTHLNAALVLHIPKDPNQASQSPLAFFDPLIQDSVLMDSAADASLPNYLTFTIPAGDYPTLATQSGPTQAGGAAPASAAVAPPGWTRRALNWLGSTGLWHAVGLPNQKLESPGFVVLYNTADCSEAYAQTILDALEGAATHFGGLGFTLPSEQVYVKVAPWIAGKSTPGVTPGIGTLLNFYIFLNNSLSTATLQDTTVHEFMHVLQKTSSTVDGRYMDPTWYEEAVAIWSQYEMYPTHDEYYVTDIAPDYGQTFLRTGFDNFKNLTTAQMNAAMSLAVYLQDHFSSAAVARTLYFLGFDNDQGDVKKAIEMVTGETFDKFYREFAAAYWTQSFAPINSWIFTDNIFDTTTYDLNAIYPVRINQPVNTIFNKNIPPLSSGMIKIMASKATGQANLPPSFFSPAQGSIAHIVNSCTGRNFYFYTSAKQPMIGWQFEGAVSGGFDTLYSSNLLGSYTTPSPLYLLYVDNSLGFTATCTPTVTLEAPTITGVSPSSAQVNHTYSVTISGDGFGDSTGTVMIGGANPVALTWSRTQVTFAWNSGSTPGSVSVRIITAKGAMSNPMPVTISP